MAKKKNGTVQSINFPYIRGRPKSPKGDFNTTNPKSSSIKADTLRSAYVELTKLNISYP